MRLKFISLNIWQGGNLFEGLVSFIRQESPDILALQEVYAGTDPGLERRFRALSELQKIFNYPDQHFAPAFLEAKPFGVMEQGNAIFSRWPIRVAHITFFDVPYGQRDESRPTDFPWCPRNLEHAVVALPEKTLNIFNTHGIWGVDGEDSPRRLQMSATIVRAIKDKPNVILAGDFNLKPHTRTISNIEQHLVNVFKGELATSFNMKRKTNGGFASAVVDMILVSPNFRVIEHYCPPVDISDHLPLVAVLELPEEVAR